MDLPQYLHHHTRYAPSYPYPSEPPSYPNYPSHRHNNYHHHQQQQPPPQQLQPPLPPPPLLPSQTSPYRPLPPPPPPPHTYNPNQRQLAFESEHSRIFQHQHQHQHRSSSPPRLSHHHRGALDAAERPRHRLPQYDPPPPYIDKKPESWDPRDAPRGYRLDFDRELHKPHHFRVESDGISGNHSRFRVDYNDELLRDHHRVLIDDEEYGNPRRAARVLDPNSSDTNSYRELGYVSNQNSKHLDTNSGGYDGHNRRYDDELLRRDEVYESNNPRWVSYDRQDRQGRREDLYDPFEVDESCAERDYYVSEMGRGNSGSSGIADHNNNRRKQIQKKSALLRLQMAKPSHKNYSAASSSHRGKGQYEYSGREMEEGEERRGSPLELDVSFKSNSLVAKTVGSRNNGRRDLVSDRDYSKSRLTKLSSVVVANRKSDDSDMDGGQVEEEVTTSSVDVDLQRSSNVTDDSSGKSEVERGSKGNQMPHLKVVKKKKMVKKTVKKVTSPRHPEPKNKIDDRRVADSFISSPSAAFGTDKGETSSFADPCPDNVQALPINNMVSDEHGTDANSCSKYTRSNSTSNLGTLSHEEINIDRCPLDVDTFLQGLFNNSDISNNVTDSIRVASCPEVDGVVDVSKQDCQSGDSLLLDNVVREESCEDMLSVQGNENSGFSNSDKIMMHEDIMNVSGSGHCTETTLDTESGVNVSNQEVMGHDVGTVDAVNEQPCRYQLPTSAHIGFVDECPKAISSAESSMTVGFTCDSDKVCTSNGESVIVSDSGGADFIGKKPSPVGASRSFGIRGTQRSPNNTKPVRDSKIVSFKIKKKRKLRTVLDPSRTLNTFVAVNENSVDTTVSSSKKDTSHTEVAVFGVEKLDTGSQHVNDGVSVLHCKNSVDRFCEAKLSARSDANCDPNETSPKSIKRRKVSDSHLVLTTSPTNDGPADKSTFCTVEPLTSNDVPTQQEEQVAASSTGLLCATANVVPSQEGSRNLAGVSSDAVAATSHAFTNDGRKFEHQGTDTCSVREESVPDTPFHCPSQSRNEQKEAGTRVMVVNNHHIDIMDRESSHEENFDIFATDEQVMIHGETASCRVSSEVHPSDLGNKFSCTDMEIDFAPVKDKLPFVSNCLLLCPNNNEASATNSNDEGMESVPDTLSDTGSPETSTGVPDIKMLTCTPSVVKISDDKACEDDQNLDLKSLVEGGSNASARNSLLECTKSDFSSDPVTEGDQSVRVKASALPLQDIKKTTHVPDSLIHAFYTSKKTASSAHIAKPRTWHRNGNSSASPVPASMSFSSTIPSERQFPQGEGKFHSNSYVRKGNSLVRQPAPVAALPQSSHGFVSAVNRFNSGTEKKKAGSDSWLDVKKRPSPMRTGEMNAPVDRPTPPQPGGTVAISFGALISSPLVEPFHGGETASAPMNSLETKDATRLVKDSLTTCETQENNCGPFDSLENQTELHDGNTKKVVYVKRKLNQLVATSSPCDLPVHNADKIQHSSSDGYYKRRKNQLIRTSLDGHAKQAVIMPENNLISKVQKAPKIIPSRAYGKKRSDKAVAKTRKAGKNSLVWTPSSTLSSNSGGDTFDHQKVLPYLFSWKRARQWRRFMQSQASNFKHSSVPTISKKLLLSRMRDTLYTKSTHGFSLKMYKVLSVGGSSLKWSKSIESRSKKANEEATRAVAAVEQKKREHSVAACISPGTKFRNITSGKRIFRIGSVRYKMDPSRRTLQRITDDESSSSTVLNPEKDAKRSYVPKRLVIGNDEYVRIGNGNQLIRNPKKRTRILASERVKWSLHTARLRLAKKRKYCQFFTRFGKCNKDDGKCPYIHDPSKVAVCTKFLKGLCSNPDCKLTHKVIPERMPDCSYFLQGLCSNQNCPYRHVHVNPKASTCEGFLKGYCADGNECRKKHSYVCPSFEATGTCPQGPKCKLHHPRNRTKGKKRKRSREQKNAWGRYFVFKDVSTSEPRTVSGKHAQNGDDVFNGSVADFISIDVSDEEGEENNDSNRDQAAYCDSDPSEFDYDDLDELIKPVRLLERLKANML